MSSTPDLSTHSTYHPAGLLDELRAACCLKNDAQLAKFLDLNAPLLSKVRNRQLPLGAGLLIRMHEATGKSISELRRLAGDRRRRYRVSTFSYLR